MKRGVLAVALGILLGLMASPLEKVMGQPGGGPPSIAAHHQEQTFTIAPGGSQSFEIPNTQEPVRIEISVSALNGGTQLPSEVMYALVTQDEVSFAFSWIGTNNDGSVNVGTSVPSGSYPVIAKICAGECSLIINAALEVDDDSVVPGRLKLTTLAGTLGNTTFKVNMWY